METYNLSVKILQWNEFEFFVNADNPEQAEQILLEYLQNNIPREGDIAKSVGCFNVKSGVESTDKFKDIKTT